MEQITTHMTEIAGIQSSINCKLYWIPVARKLYWIPVASHNSVGPGWSIPTGLRVAE